jgi:outer membrane protein assembly factor BamD (BamD/ComL family)
MRKKALLFLALLATVALATCASRPPVIPDGLTAAEIFQRAQDAVGKGDYTLAITYYSLVPKNYPDDKEHGAWASYEIAFLYHKMGKNDTALTLLQQLLDQYASAGDTLPPAPRILAQDLKIRLQPKTAEPAPAQPPAPAPTPAPAG